MSAETNLLNELSKTIQYTKQCIGLRIKEMQGNNDIDLSLSDAAKLVRELNFALEKVYRDMAPGFSRIKSEIQLERAARSNAVPQKKTFISK